jgi:hypothetical protein
MALAVHCDNFDNWNSKYQTWNAVNLGPKKDLIGGWAAARKSGLRFGVSVHNGGWTWRWYEPAQGADTNGPLAGVPYDGNPSPGSSRRTSSQTGVCCPSSTAKGNPFVAGIGRKIGSLYCTFTALIVKAFKINRAGEGNRTLVANCLATEAVSRFLNAQ